MPQIIPIRDLKNTSEISQLCHSTDNPVFITKNGYGDMVIMSIEAYEKAMFLQNVSEKLALAEKQIEAGEVTDAAESLKELRNKYGL
ncbi:MAG: type II toxin-antitoxin system prevent-host-death family antitoxin [Oscillospiraceae bacterium]|jgi:PHD/YefM family antitoxin component YafN of YafNO toxin-antitoxin module|nr:type II toxin-antitoxin system prevent-host-death family antitoxin [Oscillospiraceae bacterium]